jgi:hypothetical protein
MELGKRDEKVSQSIPEFVWQLAMKLTISVNHLVRVGKIVRAYEPRPSRDVRKDFLARHSSNAVVRSATVGQGLSFAWGLASLLVSSPQVLLMVSRRFILRSRQSTDRMQRTNLSRC